jgi:cytoskeletal protein CcmA (bactofilin family)
MTHIGPSLRITGDNSGEEDLTIHGHVSGRVVLRGPSSTATGSLSAIQVVMLEGARFSGQIDMGQRTIAAKVASYKASHGA